MNNKIIYVDFDGTIQENSYPEIGFLNLGVYEFLWELHLRGYKLVLNTYRIEIDNMSFESALKYIEKHKLPIFEYSNYKIVPHKWNNTSFNQFVDDESEGIPLRLSGRILNRKIVDFRSLIDYYD